MITTPLQPFDNNTLLICLANMSLVSSWTTPDIPNNPWGRDLPSILPRLTQVLNQVHSLWNHFFHSHLAIDHTLTTLTNLDLRITPLIHEKLSQAFELYPSDPSLFLDPHPSIPSLPKVDASLTSLAHQLSSVITAETPPNIIIENARIVERIAKQIFTNITDSQETRIKKNFLTDRFLSLFYQSLSNTNPTLSTFYNQKAAYHHFRGSRTIKTYHLFGELVRNFCYNGRQPPEYPTPEQPLNDEVINRYGAQKVQEWMASAQVTEPLYPKIDWNVYCFGITVDFISEYWRKIRLGEAPEEAALSAGATCTESAPLQAELIQIIAGATSPKTLLDPLLSKVGLYIRTDPSLDNLSLAEDLLIDWPDGSYMIQMRHPVSGAHTIATILHKNDCFVHDSYYGTLAVKQDNLHKILFSIFERWAQGHDGDVDVTRVLKLDPLEENSN